jgi:FKBP-type peptidyl-prolyl cis-trans isomerase 2
VKITEGARVRIRIKLAVVGGDVIEESVAEYFHGSATIIPGLENRLDGLEAGAKSEGVIPANEAFSAVESLPPKTIPRREFPADIKLEVGEQFSAKGPRGQTVTFEITHVDADQVEAKFVHPLAGKDIAYEVEVLRVTDPTPPPLPADAVVADDDAPEA